MRLLLLTMLPLVALTAASPAPPVRGLHLMAPVHADVPLAAKFIKEALPKEGVNVLVLEFDYHYRFTKHPEVAESDALSADDVKVLASACKDAGVKLIPEMDMLGHQSWAKDTWGLLRAHPEFDETPGKYPLNQGIYCRSYCPLHPQVHDMLFDLIDELADAAGADSFHVGMDEVFLLAENDCPRCKGKDKAELFAQEVTALHDHLARSKRAMWMWGDRLLDGESTGFGEWEASTNKTYAALGRIPKDIVICDWHYERALPTLEYFAVQGFPVLASPWRTADVALNQLDAIRRVRSHSTDPVANLMQGVLQTTWAGIAPFARAYFGQPDPTGASPSVQIVESLACFRALFSELRAMDGR
ncbi:MAG: family 20 glycosylhydrolase [Bryobacteraceae bacterium]